MQRCGLCQGEREPCWMCKAEAGAPDLTDWPEDEEDDESSNRAKEGEN